MDRDLFNFDFSIIDGAYCKAHSRPFRCGYYQNRMTVNQFIQYLRPV